MLCGTRCVPLAACVQQGSKTGQFLFCRLSVVQSALVFGVEKVVEIVLTENMEAYFGWMTPFRQTRLNLP